MQFNILLTGKNKVMKNYRLMIGIDVSKSKLDVCFLYDPDAKKYTFLIVSNDSKGIRKVLNVIKKSGIEIKDVLPAGWRCCTG